MSESSPVGKILEWVWNNWDEIQRKLAGLYAWFRGGGSAAEQKAGILILGAGGTGKTTLARLLSGEYNLLFDVPGAYEESISIERYSLTDAPEVEVVVPPGQQHRREATWTDLHADIAAGKFRGIILLVAYGYHSLGQISYKAHRLYAGDKDEFLKAFLEERRADELAIVNQLAPHVRLHPGKLWLLTLVTKQDLWWSKRGEVEKHYRQRDYADVIQAMLGQKDQRHFRHELLSASLVISNFVTGMKERLQPNVEGYDHQLQVESLRRLFETLDALKNWESEQ
jgi:hypothetical protein